MLTGIVNRLTRASNLATLAFRNGWNGSENYQLSSSVNYLKRIEQYFLMQAAYDGQIFLDNQKWRGYLRERDLHEKTVCVINPVQRLADFYAASIYPGYLSSTGKPVVPNSPLAIPLVTDNDQLRAAIGQIWQWSNWEENQMSWVKMGATLGDAPVEIIDDVAGGKVYPVVVRPENITDVVIDDRKNVVFYTLSKRILENGQIYTYTRTIDKQTISTFKDGQPFGYDGNPPVYDNPYGFCPLVWVKHRDPGQGIFPGRPAVRDWRKIEELNSDYTRLRMFIRKQALTPMLLAAMGEISPPVSQVDGEELDLEDMFILTASASGQVHKLEGNLQLQEAFNAISVQMQEIDEDHPELKAEEMLSKMSQVTGPASQDLLGAARRNVKMACQGYDRATKNLHQMAVTIAGIRANEGAGGWANLSPQQKKFLPFNEESYVNGDLDFTIAPREVLPQTPYDLAVTRSAEFAAYAAGIAAGIPLQIQFENEGRTPKEIGHIFKAQEEDRVRKLGQQEEELKLSVKYNIELPKAGVYSTSAPPVNKPNNNNSPATNKQNVGKSIVS